MLVYGEPGAGKTYLAATAQDSDDTKPILFLDSEGGTVTIRRRKDVDVKSIRTMADIESIHNSLYADFDTGDGYYKTIIIDSLTELQGLDLRTVSEEEYRRNPDRVDKDVPTQRGWGKSRSRMSKIIRAFRDLPCHTICTALLHSEFDENTGITTVFPAFPGKLRAEVPGYFDVVGYLRAEEGKNEAKEVIVNRYLQVSKTRRVVAKDRTSSLGDVVENPSIPLMWELISNGS